VSEATILERLSADLLSRPPSPFFARGRNGVRAERAYLVATPGRAGSTFLCARIAEYGTLGFPREFLNESFLAEFDRIFPNPNLQDYEAFVLNDFASENGVFGVKSDWWRFQEARKLGLLNRVLDELELIVFLRRRDYVAQAVSGVLAAESGVWHGHEVMQDDLDPWHSAVAYDREKIERAARSILDEEFHWSRFIQRSGAPTLEFDYEDVSADVDAKIGVIAEALGVDAEPPAGRANTVRKGRSKTAVEWRDRFREESRGFLSFWEKNRGLMTASPPQ
jgi:LPS sulfotransferase NodH